MTDESAFPRFGSDDPTKGKLVVDDILGLLNVQLFSRCVSVVASGYRVADWSTVTCEYRVLNVVQTNRTGRDGNNVI